MNQTIYFKIINKIFSIIIIYKNVNNNLIKILTNLKNKYDLQQNGNLIQFISQSYVINLKTDLNNIRTNIINNYFLARIYLD